MCANLALDQHIDSCSGNRVRAFAYSNDSMIHISHSLTTGICTPPDRARQYEWDRADRQRKPNRVREEPEWVCDDNAYTCTGTVQYRHHWCYHRLMCQISFSLFQCSCHAQLSRNPNHIVYYSYTITHTRNSYIHTMCQNCLLLLFSGWMFWASVNRIVRMISVLLFVVVGFFLTKKPNKIHPLPFFAFVSKLHLC